jgi:signal peptidase I
LSRRGWLLAAAVLALALVTRAWIGAPLLVHTSGMAPGVLPGDVVWVWFRAPQLGQVVVARMDAGEAPQLVRWVAGPGQTVEVSEGVLYVDGMPTAVGQTAMLPSCDGPHLRHALERWRGRDVWTVPGSELAPVRIPPGQAWLMGDQRAESGDSRPWGPVALERLEGVGAAVIWPSELCGAKRWSRLANRIN